MTSNDRITMTINNESFEINIRDDFYALAKKLQRRVDDAMGGFPINEPLYMIDDQHRVYIGTIIRTEEGEYQRGECLRGDPDMFNRRAIIAWGYCDEWNTTSQ